MAHHIFSDNRLVLLFSGIVNDEQRAALILPSVISLLKEFQCAPVEAAGTINGRKYKWHTFVKMEPKLLSGALITNFDFRTRLDTDHYEVASAAYMIDTNHKLFAIVFPAEFGEPSHWLTFVKLIVQQLEPEYGYGLYRDSNLSPMLFALGLSCGGPLKFGGDENPGMDRSHWATKGCSHKLWRRCVLRDIFPYNFLSRYQLEYSVDGSTLEEWISSNPARGQLTEIAGNIKLWSLNENQQHLVRDEFEHRKLIFHWQDYRDLC